MTLLSAATLAERWDCHRDTIYKMIGRGELPERRIGGMVRIPLAAVEAIEDGRAWRDTGSSGEESVEHGGSAGPKLVASTPEAFAQKMRQRPAIGCAASSPNSTSHPDQTAQP